MRRVLMITPHFPPDSSAASHRVRLLAPYLAEHGWSPTVLTVTPDAYESIIDSRLASLVPASVPVVRAAAWSARWTRRVGIGDLGLRAYLSLRRAAAALLTNRPFDALFITIYPTYPALLGPTLKRRFGVPFVLDYQDPWVGSWGDTVGGGPNGAPDLKSRLTRGLALRLEPVAVRAADALTAVSAATYEDVLRRVPVRPRPVVAALPLGWEPNDFSETPEQPFPWFDPDDGHIHLSYVGTLLPNGFGVLRALLSAVQVLRDNEPSRYARLRLHFFGTSNQFGANLAPCVVPLAASLGVEDAVTEHPGRIPYLDALSVLKQSTGILLLGSSEPHYTPSKIYPALLAGRPILAVFHDRSSVVTTLREATRPPGVRLVTFFSEPSGLDLAGVLRDFVDGPRLRAGDIDLAAAAGVSARAVAARLADVFDQVHGHA